MTRASRLGAFALVCVLATAATAQDMAANLEEKLAKEFVTNANWTTDYDAARDTAKKTKKPIFAYFTRSYTP